MSDPYDPFASVRERALVDGRVEDTEFTMVLGYDALKAVTRDWSRYTSDAPFRVPIPAEHDVRSVRQLPIETDPPDHTDYRRVVRSPFSRRRAREIQPAVRAVVAELLDGSLSGDDVEIVHSFALPLQSRALALMLGRPARDAEEYISWGTHVFRDREQSGSTDAMTTYLQCRIDEAIDSPGDDFFGLLATARFRGRRLTRDEMLGFGNLTFAGGRDTTIAAVATAIAHLAELPGALDRLRGDDALTKTAVEELLRFYSPLTHIGRVVAEDTTLEGRPVAAGSVVSLCFASANRDASVFERADECLLDRTANRHVAFGNGPHTCLGAPLARMILRTLLAGMAERVARVDVVDAAAKTEDLGALRRQAGYDRLVVRFTPRSPQLGGSATQR